MRQNVFSNSFMELDDRPKMEDLLNSMVTLEENEILNHIMSSRVKINKLGDEGRLIFTMFEEPFVIIFEECAMFRFLHCWEEESSFAVIHDAGRVLSVKLLEVGVLIGLWSNRCHGGGYCHRHT